MTASSLSSPQSGNAPKATRTIKVIVKRKPARDGAETVSKGSALKENGSLEMRKNHKKEKKEKKPKKQKKQKADKDRDTLPTVDSPKDADHGTKIRRRKVVVVTRKRKPKPKPSETQELSHLDVSLSRETALYSSDSSEENFEHISSAWSARMQPGDLHFSGAIIIPFFLAYIGKVLLPLGGGAFGSGLFLVLLPYTSLRVGCDLLLGGNRRGLRKYEQQSQASMGFLLLALMLYVSTLLSSDSTIHAAFLMLSLVSYTFALRAMNTLHRANFSDIVSTEESISGAFKTDKSTGPDESHGSCHTGSSGTKDHLSDSASFWPREPLTATTLRTFVPVRYRMLLALLLPVPVSSFLSVVAPIPLSSTAVFSVAFPLLTKTVGSFALFGKVNEPEHHQGGSAYTVLSMAGVTLCYLNPVAHILALWSTGLVLFANTVSISICGIAWAAIVCAFVLFRGDNEPSTIPISKKRNANQAAKAWGFGLVFALIPIVVPLAGYFYYSKEETTTPANVLEFLLSQSGHKTIGLWLLCVPPGTVGIAALLRGPCDSVYSLVFPWKAYPHRSKSSIAMSILGWVSYGVATYIYIRGNANADSALDGMNATLLSGFLAWVLMASSLVTHVPSSRSSKAPQSPHAPSEIAKMLLEPNALSVRLGRLISSVILLAGVGTFTMAQWLEFGENADKVRIVGVPLLNLLVTSLMFVSHSFVSEVAISARHTLRARFGWALFLLSMAVGWGSTFCNLPGKDSLNISQVLGPEACKGLSDIRSIAISGLLGFVAQLLVARPLVEIALGSRRRRLSRNGSRPDVKITKVPLIAVMTDAIEAIGAAKNEFVAGFSIPDRANDIGGILKAVSAETPTNRPQSVRVQTFEKHSQPVRVEGPKKNSHLINTKGRQGEQLPPSPALSPATVRATVPESPNFKRVERSKESPSTPPLRPRRASLKSKTQKLFNRASHTNIREEAENLETSLPVEKPHTTITSQLQAFPSPTAASKADPKEAIDKVDLGFSSPIPSPILRSDSFTRRAQQLSGSSAENVEFETLSQEPRSLSTENAAVASSRNASLREDFAEGNYGTSDTQRSMLVDGNNNGTSGVETGANAQATSAHVPDTQVSPQPTYQGDKLPSINGDQRNLINPEVVTPSLELSAEYSEVEGYESSNQGDLECSFDAQPYGMVSSQHRMSASGRVSDKSAAEAVDAVPEENSASAQQDTSAGTDSSTEIASTMRAGRTSQRRAQAREANQKELNTAELRGRPRASCTLKSSTDESIQTSRLSPAFRDFNEEASYDSSIDDEDLVSSSEEQVLLTCSLLEPC